MSLDLVLRMSTSKLKKKALLALSGINLYKYLSQKAYAVSKVERNVISCVDEQSD